MFNHRQKQADSDLRAYKQAVWDYLLEHSDLMESGALFVKFHTKDRKTFENHIKARQVYGYHRTDPREREKEISQKRSVFEAKKREKSVRWEQEKLRRKIQRNIKIVGWRNKTSRFLKSLWK